jgi:hypothetical protein
MITKDELLHLAGKIDDATVIEIFGLSPSLAEIEGRSCGQKEKPTN